MDDSLPTPYRLIRALVRGVLRLFFREIAVEGRRHVPSGRGGLLVAWHPNGIIDPALILAHVPASVVFGARDGLLRWPVFGPLIRALGTVPIYRAQDAADGEVGEAARREANRKSLDALAAEVAAGRFAALFPEGHSHDLPHVTEVRAGAARLYARALALGGDAPPPVIVPVGLHYDAKALFRSTALVAFHTPLDVPDELCARLVSPDPAVARAATDALTARIERGLVHAVHPAESWALHTTMHRARTLVQAEHACRTRTVAPEDTPAERALGFAQIWHGYQARRATRPAEIEALRQDVDDYGWLLDAVALTDADLDHAPRLANPLMGAVLALQAVGVFVLLPPVLLLGYAVNGPPHLLLKAVARRVARLQKDAATVKLLGGLVLYPAAWLAAAGLAAWAHVRVHEAFPAIPARPLLAALAVFALSALGAVVALRYGEMARATVRAVRVRLTRARRGETVELLRDQRSDLFDRLMRLKEGLDLPETVTDPVGRG